MCPNCEHIFPIRNGIPNMVSDHTACLPTARSPRCSPPPLPASSSPNTRSSVDLGEASLRLSLATSFSHDRPFSRAAQDPLPVPRKLKAMSRCTVPLPHFVCILYAQDHSHISDGLGALPTRSHGLTSASGGGVVATATGQHAALREGPLAFQRRCKIERDNCSSPNDAPARGF